MNLSKLKNINYLKKIDPSTVTFLSVIYTSLLCVLIFLPSCSVKRDKSGVPVVGTQKQEGDDGSIRDTRGNIIGTDTDGDGLSDKLELSLGRFVTVGVFPSFLMSKMEYTRLTLKGIGPTRQEERVTYKTSENPNYSLNYTPIRDKIAANSYNRTIGKFDEFSQISLYDSAIVKISNFDDAENIRIKELIEQYEGDDSNLVFSLDSVFKLKVGNIKGIIKIGDIEANLGFIDKNRQFSAFNGSFNLLSTNNTSVVISSDGTVNSGLTNMNILIHLDRVNVGDLRNVFDQKNDLAIRIVNYKATTTQGNIFEYSDQLSKASEKSVLYAFSSPKENLLLFNSKNENIQSFLSRHFGKIGSDGEGNLLSIGDWVTNTDYPIVYEEGGADHLNQKSWFLFSQLSKVTDKQKYGDKVSLGFFKNYELAQSGGRRIVSGSMNINVADNPNIVCADNDACSRRILNGNSVKASDFVGIKSLNIGEYVEIKVTGNDLEKQIKDGLYVAEVDSSWTYEDCTDDGGYGNTPSMPGQQCQVGVSYRHHSCQYHWGDIIYKKIPYEGLTTNEIESYIGFYPETRTSPVSYNNKNFFNLFKPTREKSSSAWLYKIKVTQDFIDNFGNAISIKARRVGPVSIRKGFLYFLPDWCKDHETSYDTHDCLDGALGPDGRPFSDILDCGGWGGRSSTHDTRFHDFELIDGANLKNMRIEINRYFGK